MTLHPQSTQSALSHLVKTLMKEKELSKFEQQSNWEVRPLRKAQMHYAALDALICVHLFKALQALDPTKVHEPINQEVEPSKPKEKFYGFEMDDKYKEWYSITPSSIRFFGRPYDDQAL